MKKTYTKPNMKIVSFKTENIAVTGNSGVQQTLGKLNVKSNTVSY